MQCLIYKCIKRLNVEVRNEQRTTKVKNKVAGNTREQCIFARCYLIEGVLAPV